MKIETTPLDNHQVKLVVDISEEWESAMRRGARIIAQRVRIPGFRPGKAPYPVILRQVGEDAIREQALETLVDDVYPKAIKEANIKPYSIGKLTAANLTTQPYTVQFEIPLEAQVTLGDYKAIRRPYELVAITDEQVDQTLENLRRRSAVYEPTDQPVREGDQVSIRLAARRTAPSEGQPAELLPEFPYPVIVKSEAEEAGEWPFPGFSRQLIDLSVGDTKIIEHSFAEDSDFASLRGEQTEFSIKVEEIKTATLPELNDDFAHNFGEIADLEALRKVVRHDLEEQNTAMYHEKYDEELLKELIAQSTIKYAPEMLEHEIDSVIHNLEDRLGRQNETLDIYLKRRNIDMDALRLEARAVAEDRLKHTLVLLEVSRQEKITVDPNQFQSETERTMSSLAQSLPEKDAKKLNRSEVVQNVATNVMADMILRNTQGYLRSLASGRLDKVNETMSLADVPPEAVASAETSTLPETEAPPAVPVAAQTEHVDELSPTPGEAG